MRNAALISAFLFLAGGIFYTYSLREESQNSRRQLDALARQHEQLLAELATSTQQRLGAEQQLAEATARLRQMQGTAASQASNAGLQQDAGDQDPAAMEEIVRQRVRSELARQQQLARQSNSTQATTAAALISQLSGLDDDERMAVMSVQGQYGQFLDNLQSEPERKERIAQILVDIAVGQNQARRDLMSQDLDPVDLRSQMLAIMSPQAVRDALAYELDDGELAQFDTYQQQAGQVFNASVGERGMIMIQRNSTGGPAPATIREVDGDVIIEADPGAQPGQRIIIQRFDSLSDAPAGNR